MPAIPSIDPDISLIAGDAIHNLRSSLDHLVFQLGLVSGLPESKCDHLYFPICETPKKYMAESPRKIKGIRPEIAQAIHAQEPYRGGTRYGSTLWALHKLDINDKHRLLIIAGCCLGRWGVPVDWQEVKLRHFPDLPPEITNRGTEMAWFDPPIEQRFWLTDARNKFVLDGKNDTKLYAMLDIAFAKPEIVERQPILETLLTMANVVENLVISFVPFLL